MSALDFSVFNSASEPKGHARSGMSRSRAQLPAILGINAMTFDKPLFFLIRLELLFCCVVIRFHF